MLIATDGACKRNGTPQCSSIGVAWIETEDGQLLYKSKFETQSTSQRGEINGLLEALRYAVEHASDEEDIIIITDSEYLYNTVMLDWCFKWRASAWVGGQGPVKNPDLWKEVCELLDKLNVQAPRVFLQWTKGHLIHYTPGNIKQAMLVDPEGLELYKRISAVANRPADIQRIINDFAHQRRTHDKPVPPPATCLEWAVANTMADCLAGYLVAVLDSVVL